MKQYTNLRIQTFQPFPKMSAEIALHDVRRDYTEEELENRPEDEDLEAMKDRGSLLATFTKREDAEQYIEILTYLPVFLNEVGKLPDFLENETYRSARKEARNYGLAVLSMLTRLK